MRPAGGRAGRAFTIIEVVIAYSILAAVLLLAFGALYAAGRPVADGTVRAHLAAQGSTLLSRMVQELEQGHQVFVGSWDGTTFTDDGSDDDASSSRVLLNGRAVRFRTPNKANPFSAGAVNLSSTEVIWAFRPEETQNGSDDDDDGHVDEMLLVRVERDAVSLAVLGTEVQMAADVLNRSPGTPPDPPLAPRFQLTTPATLRIELALGKQVDYDQKTFQRVFTEIEFAQTLNVRNMNQ